MDSLRTPLQPAHGSANFNVKTDQNTNEFSRSSSRMCQLKQVVGQKNAHRGSLLSLWFQSPMRQQNSLASVATSRI